MGWVQSHITGRAAYKFSGLDYIETPAAPTLNQQDGFSYGFMIIPGQETCSIAARMVSTGNPESPSDCAFFVESVGYFLVIWLHDTATGKSLKLTTTAPVLNTGNITDFEFVRNFTTNSVLLYMNGVTIPYTITTSPTTSYLTTVASLGELPQLTGSVMRFAYTEDSKNNFDGTLFDLRYFDKARSASDIDGYFEAIRPLVQPPPTGKIVFSSKRGSAVWNLYTMNSSGKDQQPLFISDDNLINPYWSKEPDKAFITFVVSAVNNGAGHLVSGVYRMAGVGGSAFPLAADANITTSSFSKNNTYLYYINNITYTGQQNLYRIANPLSSQTSELALNYSAPPFLIQSVDLATNGTFLALAAKYSYGDYVELSKVSVDPSGVIGTTQVFYSCTFPIPYVRISPDSSRIGASIKVAFQDGFAYQLFIFDNTGGSIKQLTAIPGDCHFLSFSPDGTEVLFSVAVNGKRQLHIIKIDGTNMRNISKNTFDDDYADWKP